MTRTTRFEVLHAALLSATDEMGIVLKRSSHSTIIREMDDFSCAILDAEGSLVAQGDFIPAQLGGHEHGRPVDPRPPSGQRGPRRRVHRQRPL